LKEDKIKQRIKNAIYSSLTSIHGVFSITIVGSFIDRDDLAGVSDIDTIVVCENLTELVIKQCFERIASLDISKCGLQGFRLKINPSFGPLKFDEPELAVIHLMIYDIKGHRKHVIASPFTCYDWERSDTYSGKKLQEIFPVGKLQPRDFVEARRGLGHYLDDLDNGVISIRNYEFTNGCVSEVKSVYSLDDRHIGEYAYHIVRNLVQNGLKLMSGENKFYSSGKLERSIEILMDDEASGHLKRFQHLSKLKKERSTVYPEWTLSWVYSFIKGFQESFINHLENAPTIYFMRHAQTVLNDSTFLGQGRDPGIINLEQNAISELTEVETVYSSPARRCIETAELLFPQFAVNKDKRLHEINYSSAEGMTFKNFKGRHLDIVNAWSNGEDPHFPNGGENTSDVSCRIQNLVDELCGKSVGATIVITHNVVLRCLVGQAHGVPPKDWHLLSIPYAEVLEFKVLDGKIVPNIKRSLLGEIFTSLGKVRWG